MNKEVFLVCVPFFLVFISTVPRACAYFIEYDFRWQMISGSMIPTLQLFDLVYVKNVTGQAEVHASYYDGDIILFQTPPQPDEIFISRAVEKFQEEGSWYFKTKGDHNVAIDDWNIPESLVIGKVVALFRLLQVDSYNLTIFSNSAFDNLHLNFTSNTLRFTVTTLLTQSTHNSFLNVTVPNELVTGDIEVFVNGSPVDFEHSINATHSSIWFDWEGTNYTTNVVLPEFPLVIVLPLFMIATLLAAIAYRIEDIL